MRLKPHSNRYKLMRRAAESLAVKEPLLGRLESKVIRVDPATGESHQVSVYSAYHQPGSKRRLYQQMKRQGWRGPVDNIIRLMNEVSYG